MSKYSPFGRGDPRTLAITQGDEALLKGGELHGYHAEEWVWITGRGYLAVITEGERPSLGEHVLIDGYLFTVRGVETQNPYRPPFGLLVHSTNKVLS